MHSARNWDEVRHYDGLDGLQTVKTLGYHLILITNQPDIERGIISNEFVEELNHWYKHRYHLDATYTCPHASNSHPDKKPNPGLFLKAKHDLGIDLLSSFHLGDTERDTLAAKNCGCKSVLWDRPYNQDLTSDYRIHSLHELIEILKSV